MEVLAEQSSVYVPISNKPTGLPSYLTMDGSSSWHIGAMQAVALESITLPSRLRSSENGRASLGNLEEVINSTGKRRIAKLEMSVADPAVLSEEASAHITQPEKSGSTVSRQTSDDDDQLADFDIDVFTKDYRNSSSRIGKKEHIFGRVESSRGEWTISSIDERDPHDRFAEGPTVQKYVTFTASTPRRSTFAFALGRLGQSRYDMSAAELIIAFVL
jgi:hypothetical protein